MSRTQTILLLLVGSIVVFGCLWFSSSKVTVVPVTRLAPAPTSARSTASNLDSSGEIRELQARLDAETVARENAEKKAALLQEKIAPLSGNVIVSYGKVADVGRKAGSVLIANAELQSLASRDPRSLSPEEKRRLVQLQRQRAEFLGMLPEIVAFQDKPAEYGQFFRNLVSDAAHLNDTQAQQVESYMTSRAEAMNAAGLNISKQPGNLVSQGIWELRRDHFNEQTASGLTDLLPPGAAAQAGIGPDLMEFLEMDFDKTNSQP